MRLRFVPAAFVPSSAQNGAYAHIRETAEDLVAGAESTGQYVASERGVLWLCVDNAASWVTNAQATVELCHTAAPSTAPVTNAQATVELCHTAAPSTAPVAEGAMTTVDLE